MDSLTLSLEIKTVSYIDIKATFSCTNFFDEISSFPFHSSSPFPFHHSSSWLSHYFHHPTTNCTLYYHLSCLIYLHTAFVHCSHSPLHRAIQLHSPLHSFSSLRTFLTLHATCSSSLTYASSSILTHIPHTSSLIPLTP